MNKIFVSALIIATSMHACLEISFQGCDAHMECVHYKNAYSKAVLVAVYWCAKNST